MLYLPFSRARQRGQFGGKAKRLDVCLGDPVPCEIMSWRWWPVCAWMEFVLCGKLVPALVVKVGKVFGLFVNGCVGDWSWLHRRPLDHAGTDVVPTMPRFNPGDAKDLNHRPIVDGNNLLPIDD